MAGAVPGSDPALDGHDVGLVAHGADGEDGGPARRPRRRHLTSACSRRSPSVWGGRLRGAARRQGGPVADTSIVELFGNVPFDPDALRTKYREERDKRIRPD